MKRFEENGQVYYRFEDSEIPQKQIFETAINSQADEVAYEGMIKALLNAVSERATAREVAWNSIREKMEDEDKYSDFAYDRLTGKIIKRTHSEGQ